MVFYEENIFFPKTPFNLQVLKFLKYMKSDFKRYFANSC